MPPSIPRSFPFHRGGIFCPSVVNFPGQEGIQHKAGESFKANVKVKYKIEDGSVGKLSYRSRGLYIIINNTGHNYFEVQKWIDDISTIHKYMVHQMYLFTPYLLHSESLDTI